jgi:hypothetical protein
VLPIVQLSHSAAIFKKKIDCVQEKWKNRKSEKKLRWKKNTNVDRDKKEVRNRELTHHR